MRTASAFTSRGVASKLLVYMLEYAKHKSYQRLSLETGAMAFFEPARRLYSKYGFELCEPFAEYKEVTNNVFMAKLL